MPRKELKLQSYQKENNWKSELELMNDVLNMTSKA
jgi:hypothetical protein